MSDNEKAIVKKPNAIQVWWRETIGELHKVSWPTPKEAWRLTRIVLVVMFCMGLTLFLLDFGFSHLINWVISL